ncbi:hypothetical protein BJ742DRAFT_792263 [Cladochytrium replicatum]|nr:hypothetical protein BJ742DRAFT_792263 [Cladochytrium replicatum]
MANTADEGIVGFTPEEFENGVKTILYISVIIIPLNMAGSLYVLYRVLSVTFRNQQRSIPASLRLPFYIVFIDLLCSFTFGSEMVHMYMTRQPPEQPLSSVLGASLTFVIVCNFVLVTQAAFFSWNRVVRKKPIDHGPYDVKLLAPAVAVAAIVVTVFASIGALGANNYICFVKKSASGVAFFLAICVLSSMIALWFFYVWIMIEIFKVSRGSFLATIISYRATNSNSKSGLRTNQLQQGRAQDSNQTVQVESDVSENVQSGSSQISIIERQLITKICMYMLGCFFQYLPGTPYAISYLSPAPQPFVLYIMAIISINLGGIVNATALILNEGLGRIAKSLDGQSTTSYLPSSTIPDGSSSIGGERYRPDMPLDTASWGRVPSFAGILVNSKARPETPGFNPIFTTTSPRVQPQTQSLYPNPTIAPRTDYNSILEVGPGPSPYPGGTQAPSAARRYPAIPTVPNEYEQSSVTVKRSGSVSRRSSEHSNTPTMVSIGSNELSEAYAIMARHQHERQPN